MGTLPVSEMQDRLLAVDGVHSVRRTASIEGFEDLDVRVDDPVHDLLIWRDLRRCRSRVFVRDVVVDDVPDAWLEELTARVARGDYEVNGLSIVVSLGGTVRTLVGG